MTYTICTIRETADEPTGPDDALIYPVPLLETDAVAIEPRDGENIKRLNCTALRIWEFQSKRKPILNASDIRARVLMTDARLTIACSKYDKGGGWWGTGAGAVVSMPLNVGSKALAAHRRRGKMLVGQVRYPWIYGVFGQNRGGWKGVEAIRVFVNIGDDRRLVLQLNFPKDVDGTAVATELIRRAAAFRLAHDPGEPSPEKLAGLRQLAELKPLVWERQTGKMAGHEFPTSWSAKANSARYGLESARSTAS